jgi:uncharacterized protein
MARSRLAANIWHDQPIPPGEDRALHLAVSESYSGMTIRIPLFVRRGIGDGPALFVTAAIHGDELNGTGAIRELIRRDDMRPQAGTLILVPVVNILGFDRHQRYLPDRRDLNRCFPGSRSGSLAARLARTIFQQIVSRCDYGIDLHTAAIRRTNYPNVRADTTDPRVRDLAEAFGCEVILNTAGPEGSFRREACAAGCPTIVLEAGEVWKVESTVVESALRGVRNAMIHLGMRRGQPQPASFQATVSKTKWVRSEKGGFLEFHVAPGDVVRQGMPLATTSSLLGEERSTLVAPFTAIVLGMTTLPATSPGEPVCHLGRLDTSMEDIEAIRKGSCRLSLEHRVRGDLATGLMVTEPEPRL